jgi:hypothetical protein
MLESDLRLDDQTFDDIGIELKEISDKREATSKTADAWTRLANGNAGS